MNATNAPDNRSGAIHNPLQVLQEGEEIIFEVRRHPAGLLLVYAGAGFVLIFFAVLAFILTPNIFGGVSGAEKLLSGILFFLVAIAVMIFTLIVTIAYWGNHWILSSDSLTQTTQNGLFHKRSAQLSLEHVEDVAADKLGLMQHIFNYGTVVVETAGEPGKFKFTYCPDPTFYAQKLLEARESFMQHEQKPVLKYGAKPVEQLGQTALNDFTNQSPGK